MDLVLTEEQELLAAHGARVRRAAARRSGASARCATATTRRLLARRSGARWPSSAGSASSCPRSTAALGLGYIDLMVVHGGARPRAHARADARRPCCSARNAAPARRQRRAASRSTCRRVAAGERLAGARATRRRGSRYDPHHVDDARASARAAAGRSRARRRRCSTATSPTASIVSARTAGGAGDARRHHALPRPPRHAPASTIERQSRVDGRNAAHRAARRRRASTRDAVARRGRRAAARCSTRVARPRHHRRSPPRCSAA